MYRMAYHALYWHRGAREPFREVVFHARGRHTRAWRRLGAQIASPAYRDEIYARQEAEWYPAPLAPPPPPELSPELRQARRRDEEARRLGEVVIATTRRGRPIRRPFEANLNNYSGPPSSSSSSSEEDE